MTFARASSTWFTSTARCLLLGMMVASAVEIGLARAEHEASLTVLQQAAPDGTTRSITFVSSGYLSTEESTFLSDARYCAAALSNYSTSIIADPWPRYASQLNMYAVFESSEVSGFGQGNNLGCVEGETSFNAMFCSISEITSLASYAPAQDVILVLVQSTVPTGIGGNGIAVVSSYRPYLAVLAVHYLNRAMASLAEEFSEGIQGFTFNPPPNCARNRNEALERWSYWLNTLSSEKVEVGGSGCTFSNYVAPTKDDCLMRSTALNVMCPVCREQVNLAFFQSGISDGTALQPSTSPLSLGAGRCPPAHHSIVATGNTVLYAGEFALKNDVTVTWKSADGSLLGTGAYYTVTAIDSAVILAEIQDSSPYVQPSKRGTLTSTLSFSIVKDAPDGVATSVPTCYSELPKPPSLLTSPTYCTEGLACPSAAPEPAEAEGPNGVEFSLPPLRNSDFAFPVAVGGGISILVCGAITIAYFLHFRRSAREVLDITFTDRLIFIVLALLIIALWVLAIFSIGAASARQKREIVVFLPVCSVTIILCSITLGLCAINYLAALLRWYMLCAVGAAFGAVVGIVLFAFGVFAIISTAGSSSEQFQKMLYKRWELGANNKEKFLCPFQRTHQCSGYYTSCFQILSTACIESCNANFFMKPCGPDFTALFKGQYTPIGQLILVVGSLHILVAALNAIYYMRYRQISSTGRFCRSFRNNPHPPVLPITFNEARRARRSFNYVSRHTNGRMKGKAAITFLECVFAVPMEEEERSRIMEHESMNFDELMLLFFPYAQTSRMDPRMLTPDEAEGTSDMLQLERKQYKRLQEFEESAGCLSPERLQIIFQEGFSKVFMPSKEEILEVIRKESKNCPEASMCRGLSPNQLEGLRGLWVSVHPTIAGHLSDQELEQFYNFTHDDRCDTPEKRKAWKKKLDVHGVDGKIGWGEFCYPYAQRALLRDAREFLKAVESDLPPELVPRSFVIERYGESMRSAFLPFEEEIPIERLVVAILRRWSDYPLHEKKLFKEDVYHQEELHGHEMRNADRKKPKRS